MVAVLGLYRHRERDQVQASLHGLVDVAQAGLVVARHHQLELGDELEVVHSHEPCRDRVAAGQRLDLGLSPALALLGLLRRDQPGTHQAGQLGRVRLVLPLGEHVGRGRLRVVAEDPLQRVEERPLAVAARAVDEEQRMLAGRAGQRVAGHALQVSLQVLVAGRGHVEESQPRRAVTSRCGLGDAGHVVLAAARAQLARPQVDDAARRVERPLVGVPLVGPGDDARVGLRQLDHVGDRALLPIPGDRGLPLALGRELGAVGAREVGHGTAKLFPALERDAHLVLDPAHAVPDHPAAPRVDPAQRLLVHLGEPDADVHLGIQRRHVVRRVHGPVEVGTDAAEHGVNRCSHDRHGGIMRATCRRPVVLRLTLRRGLSLVGRRRDFAGSADDGAQNLSVADLAQPIVPVGALAIRRPDDTRADSVCRLAASFDAGVPAALGLRPVVVVGTNHDLAAVGLLGDHASHHGQVFRRHGADDRVPRGRGQSRSRGVALALQNAARVGATDRVVAAGDLSASEEQLGPVGEDGLQRPDDAGSRVERDQQGIGLNIGAARVRQELAHRQRAGPNRRRGVDPLALEVRMPRRRLGVGPEARGQLGAGVVAGRLLGLLAGFLLGPAAACLGLIGGVQPGRLAQWERVLVAGLVVLEPAARPVVVVDDVGQRLRQPAIALGADAVDLAVGNQVLRVDVDAVVRSEAVGEGKEDVHEAPVSMRRCR